VAQLHPLCPLRNGIHVLFPYSANLFLLSMRGSVFCERGVAHMAVSLELVRHVYDSCWEEAVESTLQTACAPP